jgi:hypothetical protein
MSFLLLLVLFLFPYHIDGLLCVANKTYVNPIGQFPDELFNTSVDNMIIKRCKVTIMLNHREKTMTIKYYGENIIDETSDLINFFTLFRSSKYFVGIENTLTFVCSWEDFCDRKYIQNWSQWLFNISFIDIQNITDQYFKNIAEKDYSEKICYDTDQVKICPNHVCFSSNNKNGIINKCTKQNEMPDDMEKTMNYSEALFLSLQTIHLTIETNILMEDLEENINHQLNHDISYFCIFKQCNDPSIASELGDKIRAKYHLENMLNFVSWIPEGMFTKSTSKITFDSTSTEKTNNGNRYYSLSFIAFIFVCILHC